MSHPSELDLAAFSTGDLNVFRRFTVDRHVSHCAQCQDEVATFRDIRDGLVETKLPEINWDALASEMRANIHLGLEAGACVRLTSEKRIFSPRLAAAFASLVLLAGAGFMLHDYRPHAAVAVTAPEPRGPMLQSNTAGIELSTGPASFALLNSEGGAVSQTVSAQGAVRSSDIDGDTGAVTIKDVYLQ